MKENKDFWKRIDRLEELAGKATQGEWNYCGCEIWANETTMSHDVVGKVEKFEDAQYIDAADPAMILEMIVELRRLEKEADLLAEKLAEVSDSMFDDEMEDLGFECSQECEQSGCTLECRKNNWLESARKALEQEK